MLSFVCASCCLEVLKKRPVVWKATPTDQSCVVAADRPKRIGERIIQHVLSASGRIFWIG